MATDHPGRDTPKTVCPQPCRLRHGAASDNPTSGQASAPDQVDWAGLPINLDLAFSQRQRDKVYAQHLMRKRGAQLWPWLPAPAQLCVCETAADHGHPDLDAAQDYVRSQSADERYHQDVH